MRHVCNPMYVAVVVVLLGQALLLVDRRVLVWAAVFWLMCHLFVLLYEEPTLARTVRGAYETYRANVPRWIPRLVPWNHAPRECNYAKGNLMASRSHTIAMYVTSLLAIVVGLATLTLAIYERGSAAFQPALGVFLIFIGFNGIYSVRFSQIQDRLAKLEEKTATLK
jgi:Phospholipid methyltransferase